MTDLQAIYDEKLFDAIVKVLICHDATIKDCENIFGMMSHDLRFSNHRQETPISHLALENILRFAL